MLTTWWRQSLWTKIDRVKKAVLEVGEMYMILPSLMRKDGICPHCGESEYAVKAGKEVEIKPIEVYEEKRELL